MQMLDAFQHRVSQGACFRPIGSCHQLNERLFPVGRQQAHAGRMSPRRQGGRRSSCRRPIRLRPSTAKAPSASWPTRPRTRTRDPSRASAAAAFPAMPPDNSSSTTPFTFPSRVGSRSTSIMTSMLRSPIQRKRGSSSGRPHGGAQASLLWGPVGDVADDHRPGQTSDGPIGDLSTETQSDNLIADLQHLLHVVADEHNRDALSAKASDEVRHVSCLPHAERSRRLVEEHHAPTSADGAPDRDALALASREFLNPVGLQSWRSFC